MAAYSKAPRVFTGSVLAALAGMSLFTSGAAEAQCTSAGSPGIGAFAAFGAGGAVSSLVSAINTVNTAFLTQSTAFISAPDNPEPYQTGGGVWTRGIGGQVETHNTSTATGSGSFLGFPFNGTINCQTQTKLRFAGTQIGADTSVLNINGWNIHGGSTVGYIGADVRDVTPGNQTDFADNLQVPFAGVYGVVTKGGFFADGQIRMDDYQNKVTSVSNGIFGQGFDARGIAVNGNIGYNYALQHDWFIEPSLGYVWSRVSVDPLNTSGSLILANSPGITPPGTLQISPIYSSIGRASLRVGTTYATESLTISPFVTASIFREFNGSVSTAFQSNAQTLGVAGFGSFVANAQTTNIGTWGQIGVGAAMKLNNTGWLGYLRTDFRVGDHYEGWSIVGGLRYQFTPEELARHRITKGPLGSDAPLPYNWTGYKIGVIAGVESGHSSLSFPASGTATFPRFSGIIGGGQVGYDYQFTNKVVIGAVADFTGTNAHGARPCPNGFFYTCETYADWLASGTVRLGYAYFDRVLLYVKGGVAAGKVESRIACNTGSEPLLIAPLTGCPSSVSRTSAGWTVGGGSEFALNKNWSVITDTKYFDLGKSSYNGLSGINTVDLRRNGWISTIGLNYRFDMAQVPTAVVAKY